MDRTMAHSSSSVLPLSLPPNNQRIFGRDRRALLLHLLHQLLDVAVPISPHVRVMQDAHNRRVPSDTLVVAKLRVQTRRAGDREVERWQCVRVRIVQLEVPDECRRAGDSRSLRRIPARYASPLPNHAACLWYGGSVHVHDIQQ